MIRTMPVVACLAAIAVPAAGAERRYSVTDFERVTVEGPYVVRLVTGRPSSATARGPQESIERVAIDTVGQTLRIRPNRTAWTGTPGAQQGVVEITLTTRTLRSARIIGAGRLDLEGAQGLRVDLGLEGSGRLTATNVRTDNLYLALRGAGRLEIAGRTEAAYVDVIGSGDLDGAALASENATVTTGTSGSVSLGASRTARVTANGIGEVTILGRPACTVRGPSAGQVRCGSDQRQPR
ncbi:head GIN domain-containing protein [Sphingosinicella sp. LHD-64]|uniref:head GIN domain-containing protein n=1 Tax=Sphingosinicella sp. LHD-64 TaxID=3072139 RepID=UPI002810067B|nr:head GIN domain-containing protein [Sphingosinicella sp. LHD-64]MDQ8756640.1 head GIN domain-containing protein [Sphingosinicella sp. LHD-64]